LFEELFDSFLSSDSQKRLHCYLILLVSLYLSPYVLFSESASMLARPSVRVEVDGHPFFEINKVC
jgi:hypothetical protein